VSRKKQKKIGKNIPAPPRGQANLSAHLPKAVKFGSGSAATRHHHNAQPPIITRTPIGIAPRSVANAPSFGADWKTAD